MIPYFSTKVTPNLPGHDRRTLLDAPKLHCASGWWPMHSTFEAGLREAIDWYWQNNAW